MSPSPAESLVPIDGSTGLEAPETEARLALVARRLNRLTLQRAVYRTIAVALLAASALAASAAWLSAFWFAVALVVLVVLTLAVAVGSLLRAHARWADALEAARWVERKVPLEQRLLTLVSARSERNARLWPELVADNRVQLGRWADQRLGIAPVPANVFLLLLALVAAWLFLVPWYAETTAPFEVPAGAVPAQGGGEATAGEVGRRPGTGTGPRTMLDDAGAEASPGELKFEGAPGGALVELQSDLARSFARSLAGAAMMRDSARGDGGGEPAKRGEVAESGLGRSKAEEGGRTPDEELSRREQDDGTGQTVTREGGEPRTGAAALARPGAGQRGRESDGDPQQGAPGDARGGRPQQGGDKPADGPLAVGEQAGTRKHAGGAGAGSGKATEALLADKPLTLSGGRHKARFSLMLGGASGSAGADGPKSMIGQPRSRIAEAERGPQEAERSVRHEEIPAEYETVVKRIFKRDP
ncbi:MAG TPA: hypothetical protein VIS07_16340 [Candidatus Binatia bacterium]